MSPGKVSQEGDHGAESEPGDILMVPSRGERSYASVLNGQTCDHPDANLPRSGEHSRPAVILGRSMAQPGPNASSLRFKAIQSHQQLAEYETPPCKTLFDFERMSLPNQRKCLQDERAPGEDHCAKYDSQNQIVNAMEGECSNAGGLMGQGYQQASSSAPQSGKEAAQSSQDLQGPARDHAHHLAVISARPSFRNYLPAELQIDANELEVDIFIRFTKGPSEGQLEAKRNMPAQKCNLQKCVYLAIERPAYCFYSKSSKCSACKVLDTQVCECVPAPFYKAKKCSGCGQLYKVSAETFPTDKKTHSSYSGMAWCCGKKAGKDRKDSIHKYLYLGDPNEVEEETKRLNGEVEVKRAELRAQLSAAFEQRKETTLEAAWGSTAWRMELYTTFARILVDYYYSRMYNTGEGEGGSALEGPLPLPISTAGLTELLPAPPPPSLVPCQSMAIVGNSRGQARGGSGSIGALLSDQRSRGGRNAGRGTGVLLTHGHSSDGLLPGQQGKRTTATGMKRLLTFPVSSDKKQGLTHPSPDQPGVPFGLSLGKAAVEVVEGKDESLATMDIEVERGWSEDGEVLGLKGRVWKQGRGEEGSGRATVDTLLNGDRNNDTNSCLNFNSYKGEAAIGGSAIGRDNNTTGQAAVAEISPPHFYFNPLKPAFLPHALPPSSPPRVPSSSPSSHLVPPSHSIFLFSGSAASFKKAHPPAAVVKDKPNDPTPPFPASSTKIRLKGHRTAGPAVEWASLPCLPPSLPPLLRHLGSRGAQDVLSCDVHPFPPFQEGPFRGAESPGLTPTVKVPVPFSFTPLHPLPPPTPPNPVGPLPLLDAMGGCWTHLSNDPLPALSSLPHTHLDHNEERGGAFGLKQGWGLLEVEEERGGPHDHQVRIGAGVVPVSNWSGGQRVEMGSWGLGEGSKGLGHSDGEASGKTVSADSAAGAGAVDAKVDADADADAFSVWEPAGTLEDVLGLVLDPPEEKELLCPRSASVGDLGACLFDGSTARDTSDRRDGAAAI